MKNIIIGIILLGLTSCGGPEVTETGEIVPKGEVTLYYPNGTDTTIVVTDISVYSSSETMIYDDINGNSHMTTLDFHYTKY